jgi:hypothetical protein
MTVPGRGRFAGLLLIITGAITFVAAQRLELGTLRSVGPAMFPMAVAAILAALGLSIFVRSDTTPIDAGAIRHSSRAAAVLAAVIAFALLIESAGLVVATVTLVMIASRVRRDAHPGAALVLGLVLSVFSAVIFVWAFGLPLSLAPRGFGLP